MVNNIARLIIKGNQQAEDAFYSGRGNLCKKFEYWFLNPEYLIIIETLILFSTNTYKFLQNKENILGKNYRDNGV